MWYMDKKEAGRLGGKAWSMAKAAASSVNGRLGGRPRTRTFAQVLRRKGMDLQWAFYQLTARQQGKVQRYLGLPEPVNFYSMAGRPQGKITAGIRRALREMLRLAKQEAKRRA